MGSGKWVEIRRGGVGYMQGDRKGRGGDGR